MLILGNRDTIHLKLEKIFNKIFNNEYEIIKNEFGKPYLKGKDLYFNISHSKGFSMAIIDKCECGIDVEQIREYNELMAVKICTAQEYKFLNKSERKDYYFTTLWVLKESYLKCLGIGISKPMNEINFIKDDNLFIDIQGFKINILNHNNSIVAICRRSGSYEGDNC